MIAAAHDRLNAWVTAVLNRINKEAISGFTNLDLAVPLNELATFPNEFRELVVWGYIDPISDPYISSDYGMRGSRMHNGVDLVGATPGTVDGRVVRSVTDGTVTRVVYREDGDGGGVRVRIRDNATGHEYNYMHLQTNSNSHLEVGLNVQRGDQVGRVGNTGRSSGSHLHFEIWNQNGVKINPYTAFPRLGNYPHR